MIDLETAEVVNRRNVAEEAMFDGQVIKFPPHGKKMLPRRVALCIVNQSAMQIDMATGLASQFRFGITDHPEWPTDHLEGKFAANQPMEALDRTNVEESDVGETVALEGQKDKQVIKEKKDKGRYEARPTGIPSPSGTQTTGGGHIEIRSGS